MPRPFRFASTAAVALMAAGVTLELCLPSVAARRASAPDPVPMQILADAVLLDSRCRGAQVDFGALFRYGAEHGIPSLAIMPLGASRKAFDEATRHRTESAAPDELCASILEQDGDIVPGMMLPTP